MTCFKPIRTEATDRRREVAIIIDPTNIIDREVVRGVAAYVRRESLDWSLYLEEGLISRIPNLKTWAGNGIIANFNDRRVANAVSDLKIPVVDIGGGYGYHKKNSHVPYMRPDNKAIAELAASHLIDLGLRNFAYCSEPPRPTNAWAYERQKFFMQYVTNAGYSCEVYVVRYRAASRWKKFQQDLEGWLEALPNPVGLMACDDSQARHVLQACHVRGLRVPEDIAVIGVDNDNIMCELSRPSLSSIELGTRRVGFEAAAILNALMEGKNYKQPRANPPERLVERQSTDIIAVKDKEIAAALGFIRQHACDPIKVKDVLERVPLSRSTMESRFKKILGRTIHAEIRRIQLTKAQRLLKTTSMPVKEIIREVGVSSVAYFSAMIRQATGKTPGQVRHDALSK